MGVNVVGHLDYSHVLIDYGDAVVWCCGTTPMVDSAAAAAVAAQYSSRRAYTCHRRGNRF